MSKVAEKTVIDIKGAFNNYNEASSVRKLEYQGIYISPKRLVNGNSKLHNILIFDLPAVKSCLNCKDCAKNCYAMKAQRQYTDTRIFRDTNFALVNNDSDMLTELIVNQLSKTKVTTLRIHSSGDFHTQEYIEFWNNIIKQFPKIKFYAYTKVDSILDFTEINKNANFNLISSFIEGKINFGSVEYCNELSEKHNTFICPVTSHKSDIRCGKECTYCVTQNNVCFVQH